MVESESEMLTPPNLFGGIKFFLAGSFTATERNHYAMALNTHGAEGLDSYDSSCTHVIVKGLARDAPICCSAEKDGKVLVLEDWVQDCIKRGELVDSDQVWYRPPWELKGIPNASNLVIGLTGYQGDRRGKIMNMVLMMGAKFTKPLRTSDTHLICLKFDGPKYEMARKFNMHCVNHRWLEDCLDEWKLLPEDEYKTLSGEEVDKAGLVNETPEDFPPPPPPSSVPVFRRTPHYAQALPAPAGEAGHSTLSHDERSGHHDHTKSSHVLSETRLNARQTVPPAIEASVEDDGPSRGVLKPLPIPVRESTSLAGKKSQSGAPLVPVRGSTTFAGKKAATANGRTVRESGMDDTNRPQPYRSADPADMAVGSISGSGTPTAPGIGANPSVVWNSGGSQSGCGGAVPETTAAADDARGKQLAGEPSDEDDEEATQTDNELTQPGRAEALIKASLMGPGLMDHMGLSPDINPAERPHALAVAAAAPKEAAVAADILTSPNGTGRGRGRGRRGGRGRGAAGNGRGDREPSGSTRRKKNGPPAAVPNMEDDAGLASKELEESGNGERRRLSQALVAATGDDAQKKDGLKKATSSLETLQTDDRNEVAAGVAAAVQVGGFFKHSSSSDGVAQEPTAGQTGGKRDIRMAGSPIDKSIGAFGQRLGGALVQDGAGGQVEGGGSGREEDGEMSDSPMRVGGRNLGKRRYRGLESSQELEEEAEGRKRSKEDEPSESVQEKHGDIGSDVRRGMMESEGACAREANAEMPTALETDANDLLEAASKGKVVPTAMDVEPDQQTGKRREKLGGRSLKARKLNGGPGLQVNPMSSSPCSTLPQQGTVTAPIADSSGGNLLVSVAAAVQAPEKREVAAASAHSDGAEQQPGMTAGGKGGRLSGVKRGGGGRGRKAPPVSVASELPEEVGEKAGNVPRMPAELEAPGERAAAAAEGRHGKSTTGGDVEVVAEKPEGKRKQSRGPPKKSAVGKGGRGKQVVASPLPKQASNDDGLRAGTGAAEEDGWTEPEEEQGDVEVVVEPVVEAVDGVCEEHAASMETTEDKVPPIEDPERRDAEPVVEDQFLEKSSKGVPEKMEAKRGRPKSKKAEAKVKKSSVKTADVKAKKPSIPAADSNKKGRAIVQTTNGVKKGAEVSGSGTGVRKVLIVKKPMCFGLGGLTDQKEGFKRLIRKLKGRMCGESGEARHEWHDRATHVILTRPLRRTEKFFAGCAAGRWLLTPEYLDASVKAGAFLDERLYEWHGVGNNEDNTVDLTAPRHWRKSFEATGHGAFHRLRVVIYGDTIAPPQDTLKRAIEAGGGKVLAMVPPYNGALASGVDFAIVSQFCLRADVWVSKFLDAGLPCVSPEYFVTLVAKPKEPLDQFVLFDMEVPARAGLQKLEEARSIPDDEEEGGIFDDGRQGGGPEAQEGRHGRQDEDVDDEAESEDWGDDGTRDDMAVEENGADADDVPCQVCKRTDGDDTMILCGNEDGSKGCGAGVHLQCMNPPMTDVPEDNWYCEQCANV